MPTTFNDEKSPVMHYRVLGFPLILGGLSTLCSPGLAQTMYLDVVGTTVEFTGIQETTQSSGDPAILFGMPSGLNDTLEFSPTNFTSSASSGGNDTTQSLLELAVSSAPSHILDAIQFDVSGDTMLTEIPPFGTSATNTSVNFSGTVMVTADTSGPIAPVVISLSGFFTPSDSFSLPANFGTSMWSGTALIDIGSVVPNATEIQVQLTNTLSSNTAAGSSSATIQASNALVSATTVATAVPEPSQIFGTVLALGLGALFFRTRRQKSAKHHHVQKM